jgi:hypothetical protein
MSNNFGFGGHNACIIVKNGSQISDTRFDATYKLLPVKEKEPYLFVPSHTGFFPSHIELYHWPYAINRFR